MKCDMNNWEKEFDKIWPTVKTEMGIDEPYPYRDGIKSFISTLLAEKEAQRIADVKAMVVEPVIHEHSFIVEPDDKKCIQCAMIKGWNNAMQTQIEKAKTLRVEII